MKIKSVSYIMSGVFAFSTLAGPNISLAQSTMATTSKEVLNDNREVQKIEVAAKLAENIFFIQQQKALLQQAQEQLKTNGADSLLDSAEKISIYAAIGFAGAAAISFYKFKKSADIRGLMWMVGAMFSGVMSAGFAKNALIAKFFNDKATDEEKEELTQAIQQSQDVLSRLEADTKSRLEAFRRLDPQIDQKIGQLLMNESHRIEKINAISRELGEARSQLNAENKNVGVASFVTALSTASLIKTIVAAQKSGGLNAGSNKVKLAVSGALAAALATNTYYQYNQRESVLKNIDDLQADLKTLEQEYKAAIVSALTTM